MILDRGMCRIYRAKSVTPIGGKPKTEDVLFFESYYGELSFETGPARPTPKREENQTAARIRILQNRGIRQGDTAELIPFDGAETKAEKYRVTRAWNGEDDGNGEPITDLTLEVYER